MIAKFIHFNFSLILAVFSIWNQDHNLAKKIKEKTYKDTKCANHNGNVLKWLQRKRTTHNNTNNINCKLRILKGIIWNTTAPLAPSLTTISGAALVAVLFWHIPIHAETENNNKEKKCRNCHSNSILKIDCVLLFHFSVDECVNEKRGKSNRCAEPTANQKKKTNI